MKHLPLAVIFSITLFSCGRKPVEEKASLGFEMKNLKVESSRPCAMDSVGCASFELNYPVFSGLDTTIAKKIQAAIDTIISVTEDPDSKGKPRRVIAEEFVRGYEEFIKEAPDGLGMGWYYKADANVQILTDTLISLSIDQEYYTGGAHGGTDTHFINIDPRSGSAFTLENILREGYKSTLDSIGERIFRRERELTDTASLQDNYFEFENNNFQLNDNYGFNQEGILFYFNSYEIAPYAAGPTEILIPYSEIKDWLKK